jgi:DNA polymerase-3 subunit epsilon
MINAALEKLECGRLKNEALDIDMMHRKLNDITDKQFSLNELSEIYKLNTERNSSTEDATKRLCYF